MSPAKLTVETVQDEPNMVLTAAPADGKGAVLMLTTRWGAGGAVAIEHTWGALLLELPASLRRGQVVRLGKSADEKAEYAEGHSVSSYRSQRVTGSIRVIEIDGDAAELDLDLLATAPIVDREGRGNVPMKGVIDAKRVTRRRDCP